MSGETEAARADLVSDVGRRREDRARVGTSLRSTTGEAAPPLSYNPDLERIEIELLLEGIFRHYGFDFRSYAYASIRRRLWRRIEAARGPSTASR